jgi:L-rhamnose mutarotase
MCATRASISGSLGVTAGLNLPGHADEEGLRMERVCFQLHVRPERLDEYRERHRAVWPEMLDALRAAGWRNYSLFLRPDGLLIGYLETEDFEAAQRAMEETQVNARWQAEMAPLFAAELSFERLDEVFHTD